MDVEDVLGEFRAVNITTKSAIYVWGYNQCGQTGRKGKECYLRIPKCLPPDLFGCPGGFNSRWLDIACGREHTAAVASDGSLFTWGANDFGQLGDGTEEGRKHPKKVKLLQTEIVKSVSCGAHCTAAIAEPHENDGTVSTSRLWVWGQNQGSNYPRLYWGAFTPNTIVRQVSCGAVHVVALSEDGLLQAWGYNEYGQLGRGFTCEGLQGARVLNAYAKFLEGFLFMGILLMEAPETRKTLLAKTWLVVLMIKVSNKPKKDLLLQVMKYDLMVASSKNGEKRAKKQHQAAIFATIERNEGRTNGSQSHA